jgi:hypothetical protein
MNQRGHSIVNCSGRRTFGSVFRLAGSCRAAVVLAALLANVLCALPLQAMAANSRSEHIVYFHHTPYELNIYKIHGSQPGPTLMLIGGIQGNEPGGFLSADLYADMTLERGNMIVVPRANFNSILQFKRGVNGDMNRRFACRERGDTDDHIVDILKSLISESDCLLNLHDGSGFYFPEWRSPQVNPLRYGQSIIADAERIYSQRYHRWLELRAMAERVLARVNTQISQPRYRFRFNNHRTAEPDSLHPEQRKSATYYALSTHGIPAFGVETSKSLPSTDMKVRHHNLIINAFMEELGIVPENPPVRLQPPRLDYLVIAVNNSLPVAVRHRQTLHLQPGDSLEVVHIEANYERGLSADLLGFGSLNDLRTSFVIDGDTDVVVRKDHLECGRIHLKVDSGPVSKPAFAPADAARLAFVLKVNGRQLLFENESRVHLVLGDHVEVVDVLLPSNLTSKVKVNVKGYISNPKNNTGEDRGSVFDTGTDLLRRHSIDKRGRHYLVLVQAGDRTIGRLHLLFEMPHLYYLAVCVDGTEKRWYQPGETIHLHRTQTLQIMDIQANTPRNETLSIRSAHQALDLGNTWQERVLHFAALFPDTAAQSSDAFSWTVKRRNLALGQVFVRVSP